MQADQDSQYQLIRDAARADPNKPFSNDEFEQAISDLIVFAQHRCDAVTSQVTAVRGR